MKIGTSLVFHADSKVLGVYPPTPIIFPWNKKENKQKKNTPAEIVFCRKYRQGKYTPEKHNPTVENTPSEHNFFVCLFVSNMLSILLGATLLLCGHRIPPTTTAAVNVPDIILIAVSFLY